MTEAWCGLCGVGPVSAAELAEHYRELHSLRPGETAAPPMRFPPKRRRRRREPAANERVDQAAYTACERCGSPLIDDEAGICRWCA